MTDKREDHHCDDGYTDGSYTSHYVRGKQKSNSAQMKQAAGYEKNKQ